MNPTFVVAYVVGVTPGKWVGVWKERMPRHPIAIVRHSSATALAALAEGTADVAFVRMPMGDDSLSAIPLYEEKPFVVAPKDHAIEAVDSVMLADLDHENVLDGTWEEAVELVATGAGVALMPQSVARALARRDVVARPVVDAPVTRIALAWPTDRTTSAVEEFIGIVRGRTANSSRGRT